MDRRTSDLTPARVGRELQDEDQFECGYEKDNLNLDTGYPIRWWLYVHATRARPQGPRKGVVDRGFRFARGGRVNTEMEAGTAIRLAAIAAKHEIWTWRHQPSHALGPGGELIPLDEVVQGEIGSGP